MGEVSKAIKAAEMIAKQLPRQLTIGQVHTQVTLQPVFESYAR